MAHIFTRILTTSTRECVYLIQLYIPPQTWFSSGEQWPRNNTPSSENNVSSPDRDLGRGKSRPRSVERQDSGYDGLTLTAEKEDVVSMRIQGVVDDTSASIGPV